MRSHTSVKEEAVRLAGSGSRAAPVRLPVSWKVWLAREQPGRAAAALALVLGATAVARVVTGQQWASVLAFLLLALALRDFALPLRFTLTEGYAEMRGLAVCQRIEWARVKSVYRDAWGLKLSPLSSRSRLEAYRGVYLRLPAEQADGIVEIAKTMATGREAG